MPASSSDRPTRPKRSRTNSSTRSRRSRQLEKTEIIINVYDLLPPGRLASLLWLSGTSLLHSGVVIHDREYAYGGHAQPHLTGVYHTPPLTAPPGGTFRVAVLQGFTYASHEEIDRLIKEVSREFLGTKYDLLRCNCNHFTQRLVEKITGGKAPGWLNRAAGMGVMMPCVVPKEWVQPPEADPGDAWMLEEADGEESGEDGELLGSDRRRSQRRVSGERGGEMRDSAGRVLPGSERAPVGR